jgi:hypothetical protein
MTKQTSINSDDELLQAIFQSAKEHGENSDPDHEVGDLQDLVCASLAACRPGERAIRSSVAPWIVNGWCDGPIEAIERYLSAKGK